MNRNKLKTYAPEARRDFIEAVTARAAQYGLTAKKIEPMTVEGDVAMIAGKPYSKAVGEKRKKLDARINRDGFEQTMEAMAYTWFNRLVAIRFMELHEYLDHGYRVLSHPQGHSLPEIVEHAEHVDLPGLDKKKVIELKLDGTKEEELYRMLLIGQCNALSKAMPFLFESIDDETELLLPDHMLHSDSLIRNLVNEIPEEDWQEVEIIGWLYQFYISEKKDEVIGKVVKSEDIPAATQLFTPNWIVKYLVQNSLGRQWMATYPDSPLKEQMEYYIEPAEQTPEVQSKLAEITPDSLNPEELTLCDPACGSGHILVEAYDLLKAVYQERGYRAKDIPRLILEKNLYGLEIDDRAAQLSAFALMMKARADDRNIFERGVQPQVLAIQESTGLNPLEITAALNAQLPDGSTADISESVVAQLIALFENGKTLGSLIQVPPVLEQSLTQMKDRCEKVRTHGDMFQFACADTLLPMLHQCMAIARNYDAVAMNPPYMGGRNGMNPTLKDYVEANCSLGKADLFGAFIEQGCRFTKDNGYLAMITMEAWMFLPSFKELRPHLLSSCATWSMLHLGPRAFDTISGEIVRTTAFSFQKVLLPNVIGTYHRLVRGKSEAEKRQLFKDRSSLYCFNSADLARVPESRWAYWLTDAVLACFDQGADLESVAPVRQGFQTGNNDYFMRYWHEVGRESLKLDATCKEDVFSSGAKWVPYNKGGDYRKWYGNNEYVVAFDKTHYEMLRVSGNCLPSRQLYFRESVTWSAMGGVFGARLSPEGFTFSAKGACAFPTTCSANFVLAVLNSKVAAAMFEFLAPTLDFNVGSIRQIPLVDMTADNRSKAETISAALVDIARKDWDQTEESWDFQQLPILRSEMKCDLISDSADRVNEWRTEALDSTMRLEKELNSLLLRAYSLDAEMSPDVDEQDVTLLAPDRKDDAEGIVSYSIGCMVGRYSLDQPGLVYAHGGNESFDSSKYKTFAADEDGIVPLTEFHWFEDDAASRFEKFVATAWSKDHLEINLEFVAESLGKKRGESPRDAIRRYLASDFFKFHLSLYKKRPIYWLFSSGKQRGFQALVYLHRYNEGTLARMRTEYVIPLLGKMTARIDHLTDDIPAASSSQHRKRLEKEKDTVVKQLAEVQEFDEKLRHYADQRISLDLDDGVKVSYGKFGSLLADVKKVTGKNPKD